MVTNTCAEQATEDPRLTSADMDELVRLVAEVCDESGHGQVTVRIRDGWPAFFEKVVTVTPPSRRQVATT
jgi:hypothetical protein